MLKRLLALVPLLGIVIAACGSDSEEQASPTSTLSITSTAEAGLAVGNPAPPFTLPTSDGGSVSLADYQQPVLLFFHMAGG